jgi:RNA polymerase sigma-70 factor (ECF subfamily)
MDISPEHGTTASMADSTFRFIRLVKPVYASIKRHASMIARTECDAEDLLQESLIKAWENLEQLRDEEHFKGWVIRIMKQTYLERARKNTRRETICSITTEAEYDEVEIRTQAQTAVSEIELRQALATLDRRDRTSLLLSVLGGVTVEELSVWQECGVDCMKKRMERIRKKVRNYLYDDNGGRGVRLALANDITSETLESIDQLRSRGSVKLSTPI